MRITHRISNNTVVVLHYFPPKKKKNKSVLRVGACQQMRKWKVFFCLPTRLIMKKKKKTKRVARSSVSLGTDPQKDFNYIEDEARANCPIHQNVFSFKWRRI